MNTTVKNYSAALIAHMLLGLLFALVAAILPMPAVWLVNFLAGTSITYLDVFVGAYLWYVLFGSTTFAAKGSLCKQVFSVFGGLRTVPVV